MINFNKLKNKNVDNTSRYVIFLNSLKISNIIIYILFVVFIFFILFNISKIYFMKKEFS